MVVQTNMSWVPEFASKQFEHYGHGGLPAILERYLALADSNGR